MTETLITARNNHCHYNCLEKLIYSTYIHLTTVYCKCQGDSPYKLHLLFNISSFFGSLLGWSSSIKYKGSASIDEYVKDRGRCDYATLTLLNHWLTMVILNKVNIKIIATRCDVSEQASVCYLHASEIRTDILGKTLKTWTLVSLFFIWQGLYISKICCMYDVPQ